MGNDGDLQGSGGEALFRRLKAMEIAPTEHERLRLEFLSSLDDARASLARGEGRVISEQSVRELSDEVKQWGRARLAAELAAHE